MEIFVSLDTYGFDHKASKNEIIAIKNRAVNNWGSIDITEAAELIGNLGYAFVPGRLVGGIKSENCVGMQVFALDFDSGISFNEIKSRCDFYGLQITFAYYTFSSNTEIEKFRVVFVHEYYIDDCYAVKIMLNMLHAIFPECDRACKNLDRIFLGGKRLIYLNADARYTLVQLPSILQKIWSSNRHTVSKTRDFCKKNNILMINGCMAIGLADHLLIPEEISASMDSSIIHTIGKSTNAQILVIEVRGMYQIVTRAEPLVRRKILENENCALLNDFNDGVNLNHNSRFLLLTNLKYINGGVKHFFHILKKNYNEKTVQKWERDYKSIIKNYKPKKCSDGYCPYYDSCGCRGTLINALKAEHKITGSQCTYVSLERAWEAMNENLSNAYYYGTTGMHLIKAQTAIGKTSAYIQLIADNPSDKFIIAVPTNILKKQVADELVAKGGLRPDEIFTTASIRDPEELLPKEILNQTMYYHNSGLHAKQKNILMEYYEQIKNNPLNTAAARQCEKLLTGLDALKDERVIVTTHAKLLQMPKEAFNEYTVIIDEDILYLQIMSQIHTIGLRTLEELQRSEIPVFSAIANTILDAREGEYIKLMPAPFASPMTQEELESNGLICNDENDINDLLLAGAAVITRDAYGKTLSAKYLCPQKLPPAKYIILSATLNEHLYQEYFGSQHRIFTYPQEKAQYQGSLIQYTYHTFGRNSLSKMPEVFDFARSTAGSPDVPIITFKKFENQDISNCKLHFGNTTGINALEGKDLVVIGTPYKSEEAYKLLACYLKADINNEKDKTPRQRWVDYNGYHFQITTYANSLLREIQLNSFESDLEQTIGRARLLRYDCTVWVYSSFPCEQAKLQMEEYLLQEE